MKRIMIVTIALVAVFAACKKSEIKPAGTVGATSAQTQNGNNAQTQNESSARSSNGSAGIELVYYDSMLVKMNLYQLSEQAAHDLLAHNKSINKLYEADGFKTVTDAIQGDGYNPVWQEVDIVFNSGFAPRQFYSDTQVLSAASGTNPEITLVPTNEVYRCDIIQHTKIQ
jgi:hypothetical protein